MLKRESPTLRQAKYRKLDEVHFHRKKDRQERPGHSRLGQGQRPYKQSLRSKEPSSGELYMTSRVGQLILHVVRRVHHSQGIGLLRGLDGQRRRVYFLDRPCSSNRVTLFHMSDNGISGLGISSDTTVAQNLYISAVVSSSGGARCTSALKKSNSRTGSFSVLRLRGTDVIISLIFAGILVILLQYRLDRLLGCIQPILPLFTFSQ